MQWRIYANVKSLRIKCVLQYIANDHKYTISMLNLVYESMHIFILANIILS